MVGGPVAGRAQPAAAVIDLVRVAQVRVEYTARASACSGSQVAVVRNVNASPGTRKRLGLDRRLRASGRPRRVADAPAPAPGRCRPARRPGRRARRVRAGNTRCRRPHADLRPPRALEPCCARAAMPRSTWRRLGADVADGDAQAEASLDARVGEEDRPSSLTRSRSRSLSRSSSAAIQRLVSRPARRAGRQRKHTRPKGTGAMSSASGSAVDGRLPARPPGPGASRSRAAQAVEAEVPQQHPHLDAAGPAAQLRDVLAVVAAGLRPPRSCAGTPARG